MLERISTIINVIPNVGGVVNHLDSASGWWFQALDVFSSCSLLVTDMAVPPATTAALAAPILAAVATCLIRLPAVACCYCVPPAIVGTTLQAQKCEDIQILQTLVVCSRRLCQQRTAVKKCYRGSYKLDIISL